MWLILDLSSIMIFEVIEVIKSELFIIFVNKMIFEFIL